METMYKGQSALATEEETKKIWWQSQIFLLIMFIGIVAFMMFVGWVVTSYLQTPYAHWSVSKQEIISVYTANGEKLPISPLPKKYEIINVQ